MGKLRWWLYLEGHYRHLSQLPDIPNKDEMRGCMGLLHLWPWRKVCRHPAWWSSNSKRPPSNCQSWQNRTTLPRRLPECWSHKYKTSKQEIDGIQFKSKTSSVSPEVLHYFAVAHKNSSIHISTHRRYFQKNFFLHKKPVCSVKPISILYVLSFL